MRTLAAVLLITSLALAGCFGGDGGDDDPTQTGTSTQTSTETSTSTTSASTTSTQTDTGTGGPNPEADANTPPTAMFTADVGSGSAPLNVTFQFDAEDSEGDELNWALDADGDGTDEVSGDLASLPGSFAWVFETPGNFTAVYEVSDGANVTSATLTISVSEAPAPEAPAPIVFSGSVQGVGAGCIDADDPSTFVVGGSAQSIAVDESWWGVAYELAPAEASIQWWQGEALDDPFVDGEDTGTVPQDTTSGHVCVDSVDPEGVALISPGPVDWTLTIYVT